jgi:hypothetical protein
MHSEFWFSDLTKSLKQGFFADCVVLELARVNRDRRVTEEQAQIFKRAVELLELAKEGHAWVDNPRLSEKSSSCVSSYSQAVDAMVINASSVAFTHFIHELLEIANQLAAKEIPSDEKLRVLRSFFFNSSRSELDRTEELFGDDKDASGSSLIWMTA